MKWLKRKAFEWKVFAMSRFFSYSKVESLKIALEKKGCHFLGSGRHRAVFLLKSKNSVIKIPLNEDGVVANAQEYRNYLASKTSNGHIIYVARCRPFYHCLLMEYVNPIDKTKIIPTLPDWAYWVDNLQVGLNKKNKLVAYDHTEPL